MRKQTKKSESGRHEWITTAEDRKLMQDLANKLGINRADTLRMGLRKLAEAEGLR